MISFLIRALRRLYGGAWRAAVQAVVLAALGAVVCAPTQSHAYPQRGDRALLIGINAYDGTNALSAPVGDVAAMRRLLTTRLGFQHNQIKTLTDHQATRDGILSAMRGWLVDGSRPGDRVFFYYSGHGFQEPDEDGDEIEDDLDETLVPIDHETAGMIIDDEIRELLDQVSDRRITAMFDSCFSGTAARSGGGLGRVMGETNIRSRMWKPQSRFRSSGAFDAFEAAAARPLMNDVLFDMTPRRVIWTAASSHELAFESTKNGDPHGVFTRAFIEAVEGASGTPTRREVMSHIRTRAAAFCGQLSGCVSLTPTLEAGAAHRGAPVGWKPSVVRDIVTRPPASVTIAPATMTTPVSSQQIVSVAPAPSAANAPARPSVQPPARPPVSIQALAPSRPEPAPPVRLAPVADVESAARPSPPVQPPRRAPARPDRIAAASQTPAQPVERPAPPPFAPQAGAIDRGLYTLANRAPRRLNASIIADDPAYGPPRPGQDLFNLKVRGNRAGRVIALWSDGQRMVQFLPRFNDPYLRRPAVARGQTAAFPDPRSPGWRLPESGVFFVAVVAGNGAAERFASEQALMVSNPEAYLRRLWAALSTEDSWSARFIAIGAR